MAGRLRGIFLCEKSERCGNQYILKQEEHHKKHSFREEYLDLLKKFEIDFNNKFLFEFYD